MNLRQKYFAAIFCAQTILMFRGESNSNKFYCPTVNTSYSQLYIPKYLRPKRILKRTLNIIPREIKNDISALVEAFKHPDKTHWRLQK